MQRKLGKRHEYKMVNQSLTAEDPDTCSCFSKPQECLLTFAKTSLQVLDIYLLFFGMILTIIIGIQWTSTGLFLGKLQMHHVCTGLLFLTFGLQQTSETIYTGLKSYKAIIWSILAILFIIPSLGIQTTKTIHFATLSDENISTLHSHVQANVSAIGPTEFAMGLEVFFGVPASFASGIILAVIAGGNLALALLVTLITNIVAIFSVPSLLSWMGSIDTSDVTYKGYAWLLGIFMLSVILPTMVGQTLRLIPKVPESIDNNPTPLRYMTILLFLLSSWPVISRIAIDDDKYHSIIATNTMAILGFVTIMHIIFLLLNWVCCGVLKLDMALKKTVVILASHKAIQFALTTIGFFPESSGSRDLMNIACVIAYLVVMVIDSLIVCKVATVDEDPFDHLFIEEEKYRTLSMNE